MAFSGSNLYCPSSGTSQCQMPCTGEISDVPGMARPPMEAATMACLSIAQLTAWRTATSRSRGLPLDLSLFQQLNPSSWKPMAGAFDALLPASSLRSL